MVSKRKTRKVLKASSETQELPKSPKPQEDKPSSVESLAIYNGELVEILYTSKVWTEIIFPLIQESVAGVSGRLTNGRYWHGTLTSKWEGQTPVFVAGYQKALMDLVNNINDFIVAKDKVINDKKVAIEESKATIINPFMEDTDA